MLTPDPTAWAHLPNARHIDGILADTKARPEAWNTEGGAARNATWSAVRDIAWSKAWSAVRGTADTVVWSEVWSAVRDTADISAWSALRALLAWPDSARMLYMTPAALRTLIDITEGDVKHQAVLLLPAVLAGYVPTEGGLHGVT